MSSACASNIKQLAEGFSMLLKIAPVLCGNCLSSAGN
jgi:hypothetical protein